MSKGILASLLTAEGGVFTATKVVGNVIILSDGTGLYVNGYQNALRDKLIIVEGDNISMAPGTRSFTDADGYRGFTAKEARKSVSDLV